MSLLRPGITIQHSREEGRDTDFVRSDVTGFIGVVPKARWPAGAVLGDFFEKTFTSWPELAASAIQRVVDPVTLHAVRDFFVNGGEVARVFGLCIETERDLCRDDPFEVLFALLDRFRGEEDMGLLVMPILAHIPVQVARGRVVVPTERTLEMLLRHCEEMNNRFFVIDAPRDLHEEPLRAWAEQFRDRVADVGCFGALYYPWIQNGDDTFAPSGAIAGMFAQSDRDHAPWGVRWPPANTTLRGVTHPAVALSWREVDLLTAAHINPIVTQPARGVVVWGARTLSREVRWMHINTRRIVSFVSEQLRRDNEWAVFENQRPELWQIVARIVQNRLDQLWTAGLLTGETARSEYLVKCDAENNPPEVREQGQLHVAVMLRPVATTEFIVVELRLGQ